jgi:thioredoxin-related protein
MKMLTKSIGLVFLILYCSSTWIPSGFAASDGVKWYTYDEGMALGKKEKKKIFAFFTAEWCTYCIKMKKESFTDPAVSDYLNENFVSVLVDYDKESTVASKFNIRGLPVSYFFSESGDLIIHRPGYIAGKDFLKLLRFIHTESYKTMSLEKFLEEE